MKKDLDSTRFAQLFRNSAPYINAFRGRTFVIVFSGKAVMRPDFANLVHDLALLHTLGIRLVIVHGARPQIDRRLGEYDEQPQYHRHLRVTDTAALERGKEAVGCVRMEIEALFSMGLANSPMAGAHLKVADGNFVIAKPYGVQDGIDYMHTGEVRRIDHVAIQHLLDNAAIVLLSPIGYSPTGEIFNLSAESVASTTATALRAHKLIYLSDGVMLQGANKRALRELSVKEAEALVNSGKKINEDLKRILESAVHVCQHGVQRVHIVNNAINGALLQELFTRDGSGTLINADYYEGTRQACIEDVAGIIELITPLEQQGILVRRSREHLEMDINSFTVVERDGMIIACAALYFFPEAAAAELACFAVHPDYQNQGRGELLLTYLEKTAAERKVDNMFVLSTRTSHWFRERGFVKTDIESLPIKRKAMYNYQRNSMVFIKPL